MNATDVVAYKADADWWCGDCAKTAYADSCGEALELTSGFALDREGNAVEPVFASSDFLGALEHCGRCADCASYEGDWEYRVWQVHYAEPDVLIAEGDDLHTGTPKTHRQAAQIAAAFVADRAVQS